MQIHYPSQALHKKLPFRIKLKGKNRREKRRPVLTHVHHNGTECISIHQFTSLTFFKCYSRITEAYALWKPCFFFSFSNYIVTRILIGCKWIKMFICAFSEIIIEKVRTVAKNILSFFKDKFS